MTCTQILSSIDKATIKLIDVRTPYEFQQSRISGAINIPLENLDQIAEHVSQDDTLLVYCRSGQRSESAKNYLLQQGYDVRNIGGIIHHMQCIEY